MKFNRLALMVLAALMLTPLFHATAQEAPAPEAEPEVKEEAKPVLLTPDEIKLWQAWIRGDLRGCYSQAQAIMESKGLKSDSFRVALALQSRCADELGWHEANARDLRGLIELHRGGWNEDEIRWKLTERLSHLGETNEVRESADGLGFIRDWWVLGPFANDRGQGFEDVLEPEHGFDVDSEFRGADNQPVRSRQVSETLPDGTVDLGAMMRPNEAATAYLVTAIWCEERQSNAAFRIGSTGPVKMGVLAPSVAELEDGGRFRWTGDTDPEREIGFDQDVFRVWGGSADPGIRFEKGLQAGWNVVLFKCGVDDGDWQLRIRMTHAEGTRFARTQDELAKALAAEPEYIDDESSSGDGGFMYRRARAGIHDGRFPFLAAAEELLAPKLDRTSTKPRRDIQEALEAYDELPVGDDVYSILSFVAAWANRSAASFSSGREENRRRELLQQCIELDPKAARAFLELSQYYTTTFANPTRAHDYARKAVEANPDWVETRLYASRVVLMKGLDTEVERELASLVKDHPDHVGVLRFAAYYAGLRRDYQSSNEMFEHALKVDFADEYSRARLLERAVAKGDADTANRLADETRRLNPFDIESHKLMGELHLNAEAYEKAEAELNKALEIAPRDDNLLFQVGQVYTAWADSSDGDAAEQYRARALNAYHAALEADPNREDIARYLEFLEGERPPFEAALQEDISDRIDRALEQPVDGDNPWEVVYRDEITVVNADGTTSRHIQEARRVTNDNGRDWLRRVPVPAYSDQAGRCVEARVYRADGGTEEGKRSRFSAEFPPLQVGDVVHVRFRVTDREQSFFGDFYGARKVFRDYVPVHEARYAWVLPDGVEFHTYTTGDGPERETSEVNGRRVWSWRASSLGKLHQEPLAPPPHQRAATVQISTYENWNEFGRWYYNLIRKQMEPTPEMTATVNEITAGLETEKGKARAVYNWVVTRVRYNADWHFGVHGYKPFTAGAVFAREIGDCKDKAILICTMLRIAGVDAYPVIINLESFRGDEDITLPMPDHFNHAIAWIEYDDGTGQFVDGTATYNGIDELPAADRGANVIVVRPDGGEKVRVPTGKPAEDSQTDTLDVEFLGNGRVRATVRRTAVGDSASNLRAQYENAGERKRSIERKWGEFFSGARCLSVEAGDVMGLNKPPVIEYVVELPNAYRERNGTITFTAALNPREWTQTQFASLTTRQTALLMPAPFERVSVTRFKLPEGYRVADTPDGVEVTHANADLAVSVEQEDGVLTVERRYTLKGAPLAPSEYPEFRRGLIRFDNAESATIRLEK